MRRWLAVLAAGIALAFGAAPSSSARKIIMDVQVFLDPDETVSPGSSFSLIPIAPPEQELAERELLALIKDHLITMGFHYDEDRPDFWVAAQGFIGEQQSYVPPRTIYWPTTRRGTSTTTTVGSFAGVPVTGTSTTTTTSPSYQPITLPGRTVKAHHRVIEILVARPDGEEDVKQLWRGRVDSTGSTGDLMIVAPYLLDGLLSDFPDRSGKPPRRRLKFKKP